MPLDKNDNSELRPCTHNIFLQDSSNIKRSKKYAFASILNIYLRKYFMNISASQSYVSVI